MKISDQAVVLRHLDYSETSQVIVFFSREHGKIRAIGKGQKRSTKKRFAVGIDLFEIGRLVLSSRQVRSQSLATIVEWKQTQWLSGLRERLSRIHAAEYAAEITTQLVEDWDPHVELFDALIATLGELAGASESLPAVVSYQTQLLDGIGALPRFDACVLCDRSSDLTHFSSFEGGTICRHCEPVQVEKRQISAETLAMLRGDPGADPLAPSCVASSPRGRRRPSMGVPKPYGHQGGRPLIPREETWVGAFDMLDYHIAHLMGREPALSAKIVPQAQRRIIPRNQS